MFELHPQLANDCVLIAELKLCSALLLNDSHYPWVVLVPRRESIGEIYQLDSVDQQQLLHESSILSALMADYFAADKMNVAALGNMVPQLHVHHIARYKSDVAWPRPVWGVVSATPYSEQELKERIAALRDRLDTAGLLI